MTVKTDREQFKWARVFTPLHIWTTLVVFVVDQLSKYWVMAEIDHGFERIWIVEPWFAFIHVKNPGAAFSLFADLSLVGRILVFGAVTAICLTLLVSWMGSVNLEKKAQRFAFALILGGALGNLKDRIVYQEVTDFIAVKIPFGFLKWINESIPAYYDFPTFNVADMGISVGVSLMLLCLMIEGRQQAKLQRRKN